MALRDCPVCDTPSRQASVFTEKNIDESRLTELSFASRKAPEFMSHRLVHCPVCDLIYADDPPGQAELSEAYQAAAFDSGEEAEDAARTYAETMKDVLAAIPHKEAALEIGAGTGAFLARLREAGFERVIGVEPSSASIANAAPERRVMIREGIFNPADFEPTSFDLVCCFMTLEHVRDPVELLAGVHGLLRPGGVVALVTHDHRAPLNRVLGRRSPIIDIEHMQLFSSRSLTAALERLGYTAIVVRSFRNRYSLSYWCRLLPLPRGAKSLLLGGLERAGLARAKVSLNVGNILTCATRSTSGPGDQ